MELELRNGDYIADGVGGLRRVGGRIIPGRRENLSRRNFGKSLDNINIYI